MNGSFFERGGMWVAVQGAILVAILGLSVLFRVPRFSLSMVVTGVISIVIGAIFGIAGTWSLGSNLTPFPKPIAGAKLVRTGIYSWVRHPLYAGVFLLSLGWALLWHSGPAIGMSLTLALFFDIKARGEERRLREKFPEYEDYAKRTRKFIPRIY